MNQNETRKSTFAVLLVHEKEDGTIKQYHIGSFIIELLSIAVFIVVVIALCQIIYKTILIKDLRNEMIDQLVLINNLTEENEVLLTDNTILSGKVAVLSETVAKKKETEEVMEAEVIETALPKGFPLSGSASMTEAEEGEPMLHFKTTEGINIITVGAGTVESIVPDATYGTKIVLDHGNGYKSVYYNSGKALVKVGEELGKGYILFQVTSDNEELAYQIMKDDSYIDPMNMIEING